MHRFQTKTYAIASVKIQKPVNLAIVSDLHGCPYGEKQRGLLTAMERHRPAAVLMAGDMSDVRDDDTPFWDFAQGAALLGPCYYVTGNHDYSWYSGSHRRIPREEVGRQKERLRELGIHVLEGEREILPVSSGRIAIMGIDDKLTGQKEWDRQYLHCCRMVEERQYTILLSHRPEAAGAYRYFPGDLVVCGHAHGGQWRFPGIRGGVYAPGQGLFPRYAGGLYPRGEGQLLVSCGLCYKYPKLPRFGNPPELVILRLIPADQKKIPKEKK